MDGMYPKSNELKVAVMAKALLRLRDSLQVDGPDVFYDQTFRDVLEMHIPYFRANYTHSLTVETPAAQRHQGDFQGLLIELGVAPRYHWFTMRLNGLHNPTEYDKEMLTVLIPEFSAIETLKTRHRTQHKVA